MFSDQTLVQDSQDGGVYLQRLSTRGSTALYSGPLKAFKASHPITLAPEILANALAGIHLGILSVDRTGGPEGIKPTPLLTPQEIAFLAPAIASALKQAAPDQRVKFQVGPETDRTEGTLYADGAALRIALGRYHASTHSKDEQLSIYALSFKPEQAQLPVGGPQNWIEIEPDQPRLALAIDALASLPPPALPSVAKTPLQTPAGSAEKAEPSSVKDQVNKQAQALEAVKAELDALKKQIGSQTAPAKTSSPPK